MKKNNLICALVLGSGLLAAGCGGGSGSSAGNDTTPPAGPGGQPGGELTTLDSEWAHPQLPGYTLNAVTAHSTDGFISVGNRGTVLKSDDGQDWSLVAHLTSTNLNAVASNGQLLVAVGGGTSGTSGGVIFFSNDGGASWQQAATPDNTGGLNAVVWTGNTFIALGQASGSHLTSSNGQDWTRQNSGPNAATRAIAANGATLVTAHMRRLFRSTDGGSTWSESYDYGANTNYNDLIFNGTEFAAVGDIVWRFQSSESGNTNSWDVDLITGSSPPTTHSLGSASANAITFANDHYWIADNRGHLHKRAASDMESWESLGATTSNNRALNSIVHANGRFVAVGNAGSLVYSDDGENWHEVNEFDLPANSWRNMAANDDGRLVAITQSGWIGWSDDGTEWHQVPLAGDPTLTDIAWTGTRYVVSGTGVVGHSVDGSNWTMETPGATTIGFTHVAGNGDQWLAMVGGNAANDSLAICNPSGCTLSQAPDASRSLTYSVDRYLVVSFSGRVSASEDGNTWQTNISRAIPHTNLGWVRLASAGNTVVAAAPTQSETRTYVSADGGDSWSAASFPESAAITASALYHDGETFYLVDSGANMLWTSDSGADWAGQALIHPFNGVARSGGDGYFLGGAGNIHRF
ncbi:MAG: hypothetical protein LAT63_08190 [Marinobacter sp.]|nr:hypothetical protein [Marinobacter sp.]